MFRPKRCNMLANSVTILGFLLIISMIQSQAEAQYGGQGSPGALTLEERLEKAREKIR